MELRRRNAKIGEADKRGGVAVEWRHGLPVVLNMRCNNNNITTRHFYTTFIFILSTTASMLSVTVYQEQMKMTSSTI